MKNRLVIVLLIVAFAAMGLLADYNKNLSNNPYEWWAKHPVIHQLANNNIICLYSEGEAERVAQIRYRILDTSTMTWGPEYNSVGKIYSTQYPQIVEDSEGVLHMSFMDGNSRQNRDIFYATYDYRKPLGQQWSKMERIEYNRENSAWSRISIDPQREDIYVSWQHVYEYAADPTWHSNILVYQRLKNQTTGLYGDWSIGEKVSRNIHEVNIHQATAFANGKLHAVYEEGDEGAWGLMYNNMPGGLNFAMGEESTQRWIPGHSIPAYWSELEADSQGNLYCAWSERTWETKAAFKPKDGDWRFVGTLINGSEITMIGLKVARNDVAYVAHNQGYEGGHRPVIVRFTDTNISPVVLVRTDGHGQRVPELEVDHDGNAHVVWAGPSDDKDHMNVYYERVPQPNTAPKVSVSAPAVVITNENVDIQGIVNSSTTPIVKHRFFCREAKIWDGSDTSSNYTMKFTKEGFYTIHYYVADSNNLLGHAAVTIEAIDAPFQPTSAVRSTDIVRGLLFRAWINTMTWQDDSRNDGKFENLSHFNIYARNAGETAWGEAIARIEYVDGSTTYEYQNNQAFRSEADANSVEYAVSVVAVVNGTEKESHKTIF